MFNQEGSQIVDLADKMEEHQNNYIKDHPLPDILPQKRHHDEVEENTEKISFGQQVLLAEKVRKGSAEALKKISELVEKNNKNAIVTIGEYAKIKVDALDKTLFDTIKE